LKRLKGFKRLKETKIFNSPQPSAGKFNSFNPFNPFNFIIFAQ